MSRVETARRWFAALTPRGRALTVAGAVGLVVALTGVGAAADGMVTGGTTSSPSPSPSTVAVASGQVPAGGGGGKNIVQLQNRTDNRLLVDGRVDLSVAPGPNIAPVNMAQALSSCTNCSTFAMALQVVVIGRDSHIARPQNAAVAVNYMCNGCHTIAKAYQYVVTVDDPTRVPDDARQVVAQMKAELAAVKGTQGLTLAQAEARFDAVIGQFQQLAANLDTRRDETTDNTSPNASPLPSASAGATPSAAGSGTPGPSAAPGDSPSPSPSASQSASPSASP